MEAALRSRARADRDATRGEMAALQSASAVPERAFRGSRSQYSPQGPASSRRTGTGAATSLRTAIRAAPEALGLSTDRSRRLGRPDARDNRSRRAVDISFGRRRVGDRDARGGTATPCRAAQPARAFARAFYPSKMALRQLSGGQQGDMSLKPALFSYFLSLCSRMRPIHHGGDGDFSFHDQMITLGLDVGRAHGREYSVISL